MPLILALRRQRQTDLREFEASLIYRESSWIGFKATEEPCLKKTGKKKKKKEKPKQTKQNNIQWCNGFGIRNLNAHN